jgi:hypothetical protein
MKHLDLLDTELKSDFLCDLFETYDTQVVYEYDRTHEGLADEYHAEIPELGLQFVFDARQVLRTLFLRPVEATTFNPLDTNDERLPTFASKREALRYADAGGLQYSQGAVEFMGEQQDWIRLENELNSIHYEFVGSELRMITLQSGSA